MNTNTIKSKNPNIIFRDEAAEMIGVKSESVYGFISKHGVKYGKIKMRGRDRLVIDKVSLQETVSRLGYDGSFNEDEVVWM